MKQFGLFIVQVLIAVKGHELHTEKLVSEYKLSAHWQPKFQNGTFEDNEKEWHHVGAMKSSLRNLNSIPDPIDKENPDKVFSVFYPAGSYSPKKSLQVGGVNFWSEPFGRNEFDRALFSYDIGFPANFSFVKGGKLPGLYGGEHGSGCSGGSRSDGKSCFSLRLMWRELGVGEVYSYLPISNQDKLCSHPMITCNDVYGQSIGRGFDFNKGAWNRVALYIQVNTIGKEDGIIQLYLNDTLWLDIREIPFRKEKGIGISSIMFSTFFGGNTPDYATPADTYTYYKNIRLSVGDPIALFDANASNASSIIILNPLFTFFLSLFVSFSRGIF